MRGWRERGRGARPRRHRARRRRADGRRGDPSTSDSLDVLVNNAGTATLAAARGRTRRRLAGRLGAERDGAAARHAGGGPRHGRAALGTDRQRRSTAGKRPSALMPEYSVAKAAELSLSRLFADRYAERRACWSTRSARVRPSRSCGWSPAASSTSRQSVGGHEPATRRSTRRVPAPDRPPGRGRRDRRRDRLPVLGARLLRGRGGLERRRRHRPGDHLDRRGRRRLAQPPCCPPRRRRRCTPRAPPTPRCCVPMFGHPERPGLVFTERRRDLRRHAGRDLVPGRPPGHPGGGTCWTPRFARPRRRSASTRPTSR